MRKFTLLVCLFITLSSFAQVDYPGTPTTGTQEIVFDYTTDKCNTIDIPDVPARAFRDAAGTINLIASHYTTWRMTGSSFTSLTKDCTPVMNSDQDLNPGNFNNNEWIVAPYTLDGITVHALIHDEYVPCGNPNNCWYNAITYASSVDSGRTYTHVTAPGHLVAASPYQSPYPSAHTPFGIFGGSNIIAKDGYYYKLVQLETHLLQDWGTGILRTNDLSDPTSWRGWDGNGYNVQFVNPYTQTGYDPADIVLTPISRDNIGKMCASLTYNTYFGKYMVVDYTVGEVNGALKYGFYYALSDDLIHWSSKRLIMQTTSSWAAGGSNYPSIIDHNDTTRNFEQAGQNCYLYYTKWNSGTYDRDLIRVPVTFNKETVTALVVNSTLDTDDATPGDGKCLTTGNVCTLRAAIQEANLRPPYDGYDTLALPITFNIPGSGVQTISPSSIYSDVMYPVEIDGYTQPGASPNTNSFEQGLNSTITVSIDATHGGDAISFHCANNIVEGLSFINGALSFLYEDGYSKSRNNNTVKGCYIGIEADGSTLGSSNININNQSNNTIGGTTNASRNLIGGGIIITKSDSNAVTGNYIGTEASGITATNTSAHGVQINDTSAYNMIGGTSAAGRNLISGGNRGVMINGHLCHHNSVMGNYIGVANDGMTALGNSNSGILLGDSTNNNFITNNIIGANSFDEAGIWIDNAYSNTIQSNYIGTDTSLTANLGNGDPSTLSGGIVLLNESADNMIGGSNSNEGNIIMNNVFGISLFSNAGIGNSILSNLIYNNSELGIDLNADYSTDVNDNDDVDNGPNGLQNYPDLTHAYVNSNSITIDGSFNSTHNATFTVQYFYNTACNGEGNGEGQHLIGTGTISTDNNGDATINTSFPAALPAGSYITALATGANNSTSEFSACLQAQNGITPTISHSGSLTICQGGNLVLTSSLADSYLWSTGETSQSITVDSSGSYTVTVDSAGLVGTSAATTLTVEVCTGINTLASNNQITIFPNPTNTACTISIKNTNAKVVNINIIDVIGKEVFNLSDTISNEYSKQISLSQLSPGVYYVKIKLDNEISTSKLIIE